MKKKYAYWFLAVAVLLWFMYGSYVGGKAVGSLAATTGAS